MCATNTKEAIEILASYFDNIVYIDDDFAISSQQAAESEKANGDSEGNVDEDEAAKKVVDEDDDEDDYEDDVVEDEDVDDKDEHDDNNGEDIIDQQIAASLESDYMNTIYNNVGRMLDYFRNSNISVFPYIYIPKNEMNISRVLNYIKRSNFVIIDWELEHGRPQKTLEILGSIKDEETLRFVVIYTNTANLDRVHQVISRRFENDYTLIESEKRILKIKSTVVMITSKNDGSNIKEIIYDFCQALIDKYGYFFISFFNITHQIKSQTNSVLSDFMNPFEALLMVQLKSTGIYESDYEESIRDIIISHLSENVSINQCITQGIADNYKNQIGHLKEKDFQAIKNNFKNWIVGKNIYVNNKAELTTLNELITKEHFETLLDIFINENLFLDNAKKRHEKFTNALGIIKTQLNLPDKTKRFISDHFEAFILCGIFGRSDDIESYASNLFKLMKLTSYRNKDLGEIIKRLLDKMPITDENKDQTMNVFKSGDILVSSDKSTFLICITPPCDVFRPYKVNHNIKFLIGKKATAQEDKGYNHYSILPLDNKLIQVEWFFYNEKYINLSVKDDIENLSNYTRPYRMQKHYLQQIISEYFAFWNRSGVDEVFIKEDKHFLGRSLNEIILNSK